MNPSFTDKDINRKDETNNGREIGDENRFGSVDNSIRHSHQRIEIRDDRTSATSGIIESTTAPETEKQISATTQEQEKKYKKEERQQEAPVKDEDNQNNNILPSWKGASNNDGKGDDDEPTTRDTMKKDDISDRLVARSSADETSMRNSLPVTRGVEIMEEGSHSITFRKASEVSDRSSSITKVGDFTSMNANNQRKNEDNIRVERGGLRIPDDIAVDTSQASKRARAEETNYEMKNVNLMMMAPPVKSALATDQNLLQTAAEPPPLHNSFPPPPSLNALVRSQYDHMNRTAASPAHMQQLLFQKHAPKIDYERGGQSHIYRDLSIYPDPAPDNRRNRGGVTVPFPEKLHQMLEHVEKNGMTDIVCFFPHGRAFAIHKPVQFVSEIMPKFFKQSRFTSFQRQVNLYGFRRISQGPDSGGYYHELFLKGRPGLCINLKRTKVKGATKCKTEPDTEPNFYNMPPIKMNSEASSGIDNLHPNFAANSPVDGTAMSTGFGMSAPPVLTGYGKQSQDTSRGGDGIQTNKGGDIQASKIYENEATPSYMNHGHITGQFSSIDVMAKASDMLSSRSLFDPTTNPQSMNRKFDSSQLAATSTMFPQGGTLNHMNPFTNEFQSQVSMGDVSNRNNLSNFDHQTSNYLSHVNATPSGMFNSAPGFSNQINNPYMQMNQKLNLTQNLKKNDNMLGHQNDNSLGLSSSNTMAAVSLTGSSSGTLKNAHNSYTYGLTPSITSFPGGSATSIATQGADQASMSGLQTNFGISPAFSQQNISPSNVLLGQTNYSSGLGGTALMQSNDLYARNAIVNRDMTSMNAGSIITQPYGTNFLPSHTSIQTTQIPESSMTNTSMNLNLGSHGSNLIGGNVHSQQGMQHNIDMNTFPINSQTNVSEQTIPKNDSNNSAESAASLFQNPFESDVPPNENKDKESSSELPISGGVTKV